jgi:hypothetical protein
VTGARPAVALALAGTALLVAGGRRLPAPPAARPRVARVEPAGTEVPTALAEASVTFTAAVSPEGLVDGRRMALVPALDQAAAVKAVESEEGAAGLAAAAPGRIELADGGRRADLVLTAPLHARVTYALVVGSKVRAVDGRAVLDAEGRARATVANFQTGAAVGPPARPVIAEIRVDAEAPEAGGEYVVIQNRGQGALDLFAHRLEKQRADGVTSCTLAAGPGEAGDIATWGLALAVGGAYDQRYLLPEGTAVLPCGSSALLGGLANDRFPVLRLVDPAGSVLSTAGAEGGPVCAILLRSDLDGADEASNWECATSD